MAAAKKDPLPVVDAAAALWAQKWIKARAEVTIIKDSKDDHAKLMYASVDQFVGKCADAAGAAGLAAPESTGFQTSPDFKLPWMLHTVTLIDSETGYERSCSGAALVEERKGMPWTKACGTADSYAAKMAWRAMFALERHKDDPDAKNDQEDKPSPAKHSANKRKSDNGTDAELRQLWSILGNERSAHLAGDKKKTEEGRAALVPLFSRAVRLLETGKAKDEDFLSAEFVDEALQRLEGSN